MGLGTHQKACIADSLLPVTESEETVRQTSSCELPCCCEADGWGFSKRRCIQTQGCSWLTAACRSGVFQGQTQGEVAASAHRGRRLPPFLHRAAPAAGKFLLLLRGGGWRGAQVERGRVGGGRRRRSSPSLGPAAACTVSWRPQTPSLSGAAARPCRWGLLASLPGCSGACGRPAAGIAGYGSLEMKAAEAAASEGCREIGTQQIRSKS